MPELAEYDDNPFISRLTSILPIDEALRKLTDLPKYEEAERLYPPHLRAHCVQRLTRYFDPLERHLILEFRLSALLRQGYIGRNPRNYDYLRRLHNACERVKDRDLTAFCHPVETTASSFALIGCSGIGKTRGIERILRLYPQRIHHAEPMSLDQVVWLKLDCPYTGSAKQLCIIFFAAMDRVLGTSYMQQYGSQRFAVDRMMVHMAHIAELHALGVLVIDEIQHLRQARGAAQDDLLNFLVTLVNTIGIPVIIIGTPAALPLLQGAFRQARRASGLGSLTWDRLTQGATWNDFITRMWAFQWTREQTPISNEIRTVLYEESQGIVDVVIILFMLAQMHSIQLGSLTQRPELLDTKLLKYVARENFRIIAPMIEAMKKNDLRAIARYDDLQQFHDYVHQVLVDTTVQLASTSYNSSARSQTIPDCDQGADDGHLVIVNTLQTLGIAQDVAEILYANTAAEHPNLSPICMIGLIADKLSGYRPRERPKKSEKKFPSVARPSILDDAMDGRCIAGKAKDQNMPVYEALLAAGWIKPPVGNFIA